MNPERPTEQRISQWLVDEAPVHLPDRVLDATLERTRATAQVSVYPGWRALTLTPRSITVVAGATAIVAALIIGAALLPGSQRSSVGQPIPTLAPSPTALETPTPSPKASAAACDFPVILGTELIRACRFKTNVMHPALSFGGVTGWNPAIETARGILFQAVLPGGKPTAEGMAIFTIDRLAAKPCDTTPRADTTPIATVPFQPSSPGNGPAEFLAWLARYLKLGPATPISVGGHPGLTVVTIPGAAGSQANCGGVAVTWTSDTPGELGTAAVGGGSPQRLSVIDVNGSTVVFEEYAPKDRFARVDAAAQQFLASVQTP